MYKNVIILFAIVITICIFMNTYGKAKKNYHKILPK